MSLGIFKRHCKINTLVVTMSGSLLFTTSVCFSQQAEVHQAESFHKHTIYAGYGDAFLVDIVYALDAFSENDFFPLFDSLGAEINTSADYQLTKGVLTLGYSFSLNEKLTAGCELSYLQSKTIYRKDGDIEGERKLQALTIVPIIRYEFFQRNRFWMYVKGGIGIFVGFTKNFDQYGNQDKPINRNLIGTAQLLYGLRVGKSVGWYAEMGITGVGIFRTGVDYRF